MLPYDKSYDDCVATALKKRPELKEGSLNIDIARRTITLKRSGFYPHLSFQSTYTRQGDDPGVNGSEFLDQEEWSVMVRAEWNFWEWGKNYYEVRAAKRRLKEAENTLEELKDGARLRVREAFLALDEAGKKVKVAAKTVEQAVENLRMSNERYAQQVATATEVLDAQTLLTRARTNYFTSLTQHNDAKAALFNAMGLEEL
jgi:outer membrane protein